MKVILSKYTSFLKRIRKRGENMEISNLIKEITDDKMAKDKQCGRK